MDRVITPDFVISDTLVLTLIRVGIEIVFLHVHLNGLDLWISWGCHWVLNILSRPLVLLLVFLLALLFLSLL